MAVMKPSAHTQSRSRTIARVAGPTLVALAATEAMNMHIFVEQAAPVVYLNGTLLLVAGVAIVQAHNRWRWGWPLLVTLTGWTALAVGLWRMIAPDAAQATEGALTSTAFAGLLLLGGLLSFQGYRRPGDGPRRAGQ